MTFLDTSYLGALFMVHDQWHSAAQRWSRRAKGPFLTTDYILLELADGLAGPPWRPTFFRILAHLRGSKQVEIVAQSADFFERGLDLYKARPDKGWSLTDCLSFVVMQERNRTDALTADEHFVQAGFRALMREP